MAESDKNPRLRPRLRVMSGSEIALGPGKVDLLEALGETGSISGAARKVGYSYRRAWNMVETMNRCFREPLVSCATGGKGGGGAQLTALGREVIALYREMESQASEAVQSRWKKLKKHMAVPE